MSTITPVISDALDGSRGPDQQAIAEIGLRIVSTLLRKNADYGSSVFSSPILDPSQTPERAIRCRLSDKIARLQTLLGSANTPQVAESVTDTMTDLAGYAILWLVVSERDPEPLSDDGSCESMENQFKVPAGIAVPVGEGYRQLSDDDILRETDEYDCEPDIGSDWSSLSQWPEWLGLTVREFMDEAGNESRGAFRRKL